MNSKSTATEQRILAAACDLFSQQGYHGTSARHVAARADVNEVTIYRYYSCKRDLFLATLESELARVSVGADSLSELAGAPDPAAAVSCLFRLINELVTRHPKLVRLIQFSALEMSDGLAPLCNRYLTGLLDVASNYLKRWIDSGDLPFLDPKLTIIAIVSSVVGVKTCYPAICEAPSASMTGQETSGCGDLWRAVLLANSPA